MDTLDWIHEIKTVQVTPGDSESDAQINRMLREGWKLVRHFDREGMSVHGGHATDHYALLARRPKPEEQGRLGNIKTELGQARPLFVGRV